MRIALVSVSFITSKSFNMLVMGAFRCSYMVEYNVIWNNFLMVDFLLERILCLIIGEISVALTSPWY